MVCGAGGLERNGSPNSVLSEEKIVGRSSSLCSAIPLPNFKFVEVWSNSTQPEVGMGIVSESPTSEVGFAGVFNSTSEVSVKWV